VKSYKEKIILSNPLSNLPLLIMEVKKEMNKKNTIPKKRKEIKDSRGWYIM